MPTSRVAFLHRPLFHVLFLLIVGTFAFGSNISISLFGETEGLYAIITHSMIAAQDYLNLWLRGEPYFNKPPLFFWMQAGFIQTLGWSEAAVRLPSVLSSIGTMLATYGLGRLLFSPMAGIWSGLAVATCYAGLWFGPLAIIDPVLTFCMTLGMYAWARAYFFESSQPWYVAAWLFFTLGAMFKNLHALALPALAIGVFVWVRRDRRMFRHPYFWIGLMASGVVLTGYYLFLGQEFRQHFFLEENLKRVVSVSGDQKHSAWEAYWGKRPIFWYALVMWFDVFPWSILLPAGFLLLWKCRPWDQSPQALFVLVWFVVYFVALSVVPEKHERYLLPLLPATGLVIGFLYHQLLQRRSGAIGCGMLKGLLGSLGVIFVIAVILGPFLLQKKWHVPLDVIPLTFQIALGLLGFALIVMVVRNRLRLGLLTVGMLGVALMVTVTVFIIPGIQAEGSPRLAWAQNTRWLNQSDAISVFQNWDWREDEDEFYWDYLHGRSRIVAQGLSDPLAVQELKRDIQKSPGIVMMTEDQYLRLIAGDPELSATVLWDFYRSGKQIVILSLKMKTG